MVYSSSYQIVSSFNWGGGHTHTHVHTYIHTKKKWTNVPVITTTHYEWDQGERNRRETE